MIRFTNGIPNQRDPEPAAEPLPCDLWNQDQEECLLVLINQPDQNAELNQWLLAEFHKNHSKKERV